MAEIAQLQSLLAQERWQELFTQATASAKHSGNANALAYASLAATFLGEISDCYYWLQRAQQVVTALNNDAKLALAGACLRLNKFSATDKLLDQIAENYAATSDDWQTRKAYCYQYRGELKQAEYHYQQALFIAPAKENVWYQYLHFLIKNQRFIEAESALEKALSQIHGSDDRQCITRSPLLVEIQLGLWLAEQRFGDVEAWLADLYEVDTQQFIAASLHYVRLLSNAAKTNQANEFLSLLLEMLPDNTAILLCRLDLLSQQKKWQQVIHQAEKLLQSQPQSWPAIRAKMQAYVELAQSRTNSDFIKQEIDQFRTFLNDSSLNNQQTKNGLCLVAQAYASIGDYAQAKALLSDLLAQDSYFLPARKQLAEVLTLTGDLDDALTQQKYIAEQDETNIALQWRIKAPDDPSELAKAENVILAKAESSQRAAEMFLLASAWEKLGEYDRAFKLADAANKYNRPLLPYKAMQHRNQVERIRVAFCSSLFEHRCDIGLKNATPVFVVGMPRSGTTLVEQILASHSKIYGAGELDIVSERIHRLERWERHSGSGRHYPDCVDDITPKVAHALAQSIMQELEQLASIAKPCAKFVVDKLPHNFENIGFIKLIFPDAKIISVRRDPRDIALSNYFIDFHAKHGGLGFAYDLTDIGEQLADHNLLMHHWHQLFGDDILEVQYEDVVADTKGMARKMLDYIGVEWEPQVLSFNELDRPVKTASVLQVRQPIYKTSTAKWKRYQRYLKPLIKGTNAKINPEPIVDMVTLPIPGIFTDAFDAYKDDKLDDAEYGAKKMLHHNPQHAGCYYLIGEIYLRKGHIQEGVESIERSLQLAPWKYREWATNLPQAYRMLGHESKAVDIESKLKSKSAETSEAPNPIEESPLTNIMITTAMEVEF